MKKEITKKTMCLAVLLLLNFTSFFAQSGAPSTLPVNQNEADFFTDNSVNVPVARKKTLVNNGAGDDSATLNNLITSLSNQGGGVITIPSGTWLFGNIKLLSNVHLIFNSNAIVKPKLASSGDSSIFEIGYTGVKASNVSIRCTSGQFKIDLSTVPLNSRILPFNVKEVENFMISGCYITDRWTVHSTVNLGLSKRNNVWAGAKKGLVKNITVINAHGGYGAVQVRVGEKILFKNIVSKGGGATLRIETDGRETSGNQAPQTVAKVSEISAYNIYCENGNSAVMIQPWGAKNGWFDIQKVRAVSCMSVVRINRAFVELNAPSIGNFDPDSRITDIASSYGTNAQVKDGDIPFVPCHLRTNPNILRTTSLPGQDRWFQGPSLAPLWYAASSTTGQDPRYYSIKIPTVENLQQNATNFPANTPIIRRWNDRVENCSSTNRPGISLNTKEESLYDSDSDKNYSIELFPNPVKDDYVTIQLNGIEDETVTYYTVFNTTGTLVGRQKSFSGYKGIINISEFSQGLYFIKIENYKGNSMLKLVKH
ncbi:T9SS type A sorting domain-containing protein [Flavobacterium sp.]|uniref:T9SS type A sorting domain-containing protein n=1 Tax=Flavobacterium sp. TaxID=239 RepID=UPI003C4B0A88